MYVIFWNYKIKFIIWNVGLRTRKIKTKFISNQQLQQCIIAAHSGDLRTSCAQVVSAHCDRGRCKIRSSSSSWHASSRSLDVVHRVPEYVLRPPEDVWWCVTSEIERISRRFRARASHERLTAFAFFRYVQLHRVVLLGITHPAHDATAFADGGERRFRVDPWPRPRRSRVSSGGASSWPNVVFLEWNNEVGKNTRRGKIEFSSSSRNDTTDICPLVCSCPAGRCRGGNLYYFYRHPETAVIFAIFNNALRLWRAPCWALFKQ